MHFGDLSKTMTTNQHGLSKLINILQLQKEISILLRWNFNKPTVYIFKQDLSFKNHTIFSIELEKLNHEYR